MQTHEQSTKEGIFKMAKPDSTSFLKAPKNGPKTAKTAPKLQNSECLLPFHLGRACEASKGRLRRYRFRNFARLR